MHFKYCNILSIGYLILVSLFLAACNKQADYESNKTNKVLTGVDALQADSTGGFARAHRARSFVFPDDHLAHPAFKHEWWYFTGNLSANTGERFGYQLTLFRIGLKPDDKIIKTTDYISQSDVLKSDYSSNWRTNHIYMGHLAITDVDDNQFYHYEKFARASLGLAGSEIKKNALDANGRKGTGAIRIWLEDWQVVSAGKETFPLKLIAQKGDISLELMLSPAKPVVYHGYEGLSQKGRKQGNASYYYSITRLDTDGKIDIRGNTYSVAGSGWFDREWSTSSLERDQVGWDWFSIQLRDGRDIMFYKMRMADHSMDRYSNGTIVYKDGDYKVLNAEDVSVEDIDAWQSPHTGVTYPSSWKIRIAKENLELTIEPLLLDQENNLTVRYWEGAVRVSGIQHNDKDKQQVSGFGYVELAGYE